MSTTTKAKTKSKKRSRAIVPATVEPPIVHPPPVPPLQPWWTTALASICVLLGTTAFQWQDFRLSLGGLLVIVLVVSYVLNKA